MQLCLTAVLRSDNFGCRSEVSRTIPPVARTLGKRAPRGVCSGVVIYFLVSFAAASFAGLGSTVSLTGLLG